MDERWQSLFGHYPTTSFVELLRQSSPGLGLGPPLPPDATSGGANPGLVGLPKGTTILAVRYADGVVVAGDRQATEGYQVAHRRIEKVYKADDHSAIAIAGAAGPSIEMARLFQTELEHYEKVEGEGLSLEGKANKLGQMIRMNLPMAMQGLVVVPIFAGFDLRRSEGRIFKYDVTGGRYEEHEIATTGSGSLHAGTVLKLGWREDLDRDVTLDLALTALFTAADEDSATGGPDLVRGIYPVVATITAGGFRRVDDAELEERSRRLLEEFEARQPRRNGGAS